jgi:DNA repair protein RadC
MRLREIPAAERPRERLERHGAQALSTTELLAILIGSGGAQRSALALAHDVLARSDGSLRRAIQMW